MDNARKKYVDIQRLSSGDTFALLNSVENNDDGDIEIIMNNFGKEFVAEDDSVISTNIIRKEESRTQVAQHQFERHHSKFFLSKTRMKPIL